tara:strand:+ start:335 stop:1195 length:861 start_codon:yes stop_codon:yes gene_type:complete
MERLKIEDFQNNGVENTIVDLENTFKNTILDLNEVVERPPLTVSIGIDDKSYNGINYPLKFGSAGNISLIGGQEKSRKSFVKSLIEACTIGGKSNNYTGTTEIKGYVNGKYIISINSEESKYDALMSAKRVPFMVGGEYDKYICLMWREKSVDERLQLLHWLFTDSPYKDNIGLVMIDGIVDFVHDFNSQTEAKEITDKLMKYSSQCHCHISCILHLNPNSDKLRGHLGTILGQKCEMVMIVENKGEFSLVRCKVVRGGKPFKDFTISIDDDWMPYISGHEEEIIM